MNERLVFTSRYHVSVNDCMVDDFSKSGVTVLMPDGSFNSHIWFFDANDQYRGKENVRIVGYDEFLHLPPMVLVIPCMQMVNDFYKLREERGNVDELVFLTANSNSTDHFPLDGTDYVLSHDLYFHEKTKAKYKQYYFNRPLITRFPRSEEEMKEGYKSKQINLYIHNFETDIEGFIPERKIAKEFRDKWPVHIPYYGFGNTDGNLTMQAAHEKMCKSMFTFVSKRRETFGQSVNESMLLGVPCIFFRSLFYSTFTRHEINEDMAIVVDTVDEAIEKINALSFEEYENLCMAAKYAAQRQCADEPRLEMLRWFFNKVFTTSPKFSNE